MRDPKAWTDHFLIGTNIFLSAIYDTAGWHRACKGEGGAVLVLKGLADERRVRSNPANRIDPDTDGDRMRMKKVGMMCCLSNAGSTYLTY